LVRFTNNPTKAMTRLPEERTKARGVDPGSRGIVAKFYFATMLGKLEVWKLRRYFPPAPT